MSITIKDVARTAGLSVSTVSKALNGAYDVSEETRSRVLKLARELDYHPNARAQNFARQSSQSVLFLTELHQEIGFSNPHLFEIIAGVEYTLRRKGYQLVVRGGSPAEACNAVRMASSQQLADGVILHASIITPELDQLINQLSLPHIVIGYPSFPSQFSWIDSDNSLAGAMAARHLWETGYRNIAFIGGWEEDKISAHRLEGVQKELALHRSKIPTPLLCAGDSVRETGYLMTRKLIGRKEMPDAIICANNYIAYGAYLALKDGGISIPEKMGLLTFDDVPFSRILTPRLTSVTIDVYDMGVQAAGHIIAMIRKPNLNVQTYSTLPHLIVREST